MSFFKVSGYVASTEQLREALSSTWVISGARLDEMSDGLPHLRIEPRLGDGLTATDVSATVAGYAGVTVSRLSVKLGSGLAFDGSGNIIATGTTALSITDDAATSASHYLTFTNATGLSAGSVSGLRVTSTKLSFNPATGVLTATGGFNGTATNVSGVVAATNGGTGLSSYTNGDLLYASGATSLAKLSGVATGNVLLSGGVATAPSWGKVGLTTHVSGTLPVTSGGTGNVSYPTTGDSEFVLVYDRVSGTFDTVSSGTSGQFLTTSGGAPTFSTPPNFTSSTAGYAPASGGGTTTFLRADGTWATPSVGTVSASTVTAGAFPGVSYSFPNATLVSFGDQISAYSLSSQGVLDLAAGDVSSLRLITGGTPRITIASTGAITLSQALTAANGGTGLSSYTIGDLLYASGATTLAKLAGVVTGNVLLSGGVATAPSWGKVGLTTHVSGTLGAGNGGTGQSSYTIGDLLYASGATTLSKLAGVATGNVLLSGGVATAPSWGKIGLTTHVSGTLGVGNGGTGVTTTPTNGQLLIGNGTAYTVASLTAGSNISITPGAGSLTIASTATTATIAEDPSSTGSRYLFFGSANDGLLTSVNVASTKLTFVPSTGTLTAVALSTSAGRVTIAHTGTSLLSATTTSATTGDIYLAELGGSTASANYILQVRNRHATTGAASLEVASLVTVGNGSSTNPRFRITATDTQTYFGSFSAHAVGVVVDSSFRWYWSTLGHFHPDSANMYDLGTSAATVRTGYFGTSVVIGGYAALHVGNIGTYALPIGGGVLTGPLTAPSFSGSGASLTSLNANNISTGTLPLERGGTNQTTYSTSGTGTRVLLYDSATTSFTVQSSGLSGRFLQSGGTTGDVVWATPPLFTSTTPGYAPASGGSTTTFLRADGTWATPSVGTVSASTVTAGTFPGAIYTFSDTVQAASFVATLGGTRDRIQIDATPVGTAGNYISIVSPSDGLSGSYTLTLANGSTTLVAGTMVPTSRTVSLTGTTNQVTVSGTTAQALSGNVAWTLSLPQNIHTGATPTFASILLGTDPGGTNLVRAASARITSLGVGRDASGTTGRIDATGDIVAASTSDLRLKTHIEPLTGALEAIDQLSAIRYQWKQDDASKAIHGYGEAPELGVIAQEVEQFFPELVQTRENGYKAVRYERLVPVLLAAIKELREEVRASKGGA